MKNKKKEHSTFKKLLEYFVAHLEWVVSSNDKNIGFEEYILPLIEKNKFKRSGQGYGDANIQLQIKDWQSYTNGQICINIQANFGDYKSSKSYLNWRGTGLNIIANWSEGKIISLYQEEYLHWEKPPTRKKFGKEISLTKLGLFDKIEIVNSELIDFFESFDTSIIAFNKFILKKKMTAKIQPYVNLINYKKQIILQGPPGTGKTKTAKDIAVEILGLGNVKDLNNNEDFELIQFHPSYTYEDFVRGIVSLPNEDGEGVLFKTENKLLAKFAEKALKNKLDIQKGATELSKEKWINEQFEKFIDFVADKIEKNGKVALTEAAFIVGLDTDAFRYNGANEWTLKGSRMLFKDIKQAYLDNNISRKDIKHNKNLSGSANWDATYFIKSLELFRKFLTDENLTLEVNTNENEELKNYVLIIDEINRANLPSVLGELIYALEYRDEPVKSMYEYEGKREIILPSNLYIIGTMNTADRSVGHIDYAIKRRFAFVDVLPKNLKVELGNDFDISLFEEVTKLFIKNYDPSADYNNKIIIEKSEHLNSDFEPKDVWLGHSYFIKQYEKDENGENIIGKSYDFKMRLDYEIKPILLEYIKDGILKESAKTEIEKLITTI